LQRVDVDSVDNVLEVFSASINGAEVSKVTLKMEASRIVETLSTLPTST
jgi:hypothetical protein